MVCGNCNNYNDDHAEQCAYCGMPLYPNIHKKKKRMKWIALISGVAVAVICLMLGIVIVNNQVTHRKYEDKVKRADRYLAESDYDSAIRVYNEALKINDKDVDIYVKLARVYQMTGDMESLDHILTLGYQRTQSKGIKAMINQLVNYGYVEGFGFVNKETGQSDSGNKSALGENTESEDEAPFLQNDFFDSILDKGYTDYTKKYGTGVIAFENGSDVVSISYNEFDAKLWYINGKTNLTDTSNGVPLGNIVPSYITVSSLDVIIGNANGTLKYEDVCDIFNENPKIQQDNKNNYLMVHYKGCTVYLDCDENGNIDAENCKIKIVCSTAGKNKDEKSNTGLATGKIMDATDAKGIDSVKLTFRKGSDNQYGEEILETETDDGGNYSAELEEDTYTVCAEKEGYQTEYFEITVQKGQTFAEQNLSMSPELASGEARIVLEWGAVPNDLDAHVFGNSGGEEFHVYFSNMEFNDLVMLDVDDRSAYGPETITIKDISQGTFIYGVHDYSNGLLGDANEMLGQSGATVKLYLPNENQPRVYTVPEGYGTYWEVFQIENGKVTDIGQLRDGY